MQTLFESAGLKIISAEVVVRHPEETEFARRWAALSGDVQTALLSNPFSMVYQVVIKAVPADRAGQSVSLMSMKVQPGNCSMRAGWKVRVKNKVLKFLGRRA